MRKLLLKAIFVILTHLQTIRKLLLKAIFVIFTHGQPGNKSRALFKLTLFYIT
jgi:hypothetical protein